MDPLTLEAEVGATITLDASRSYDPDGDRLKFKWYQYKDVTATQWWVDAEVAMGEATPSLAKSVKVNGIMSSNASVADVDKDEAADLSRDERKLLKAMLKSELESRR